MGTRTVHRVRCKPSADTIKYYGNIWHVDVEVTDAITFVGPDNQEVVLDFSLTTQPVPKIVDHVGAGVAADPSTPTRVSHMKRIAKPGEASQSLFVEVLDTVSVEGPDGEQTIYQMPSESSVGMVEDRANIGITGAASGDNPTRRGHTVKVQATVNPVSTEYIGVVTLDRIGYTGPNGEQMVLDLSTYQTIDKTKYTIDGNGNASPPLNTDPNPYVKFPHDSYSPWVQCGEDNKGVAQGMLWRIVKTAANPEPWWIWTPTYQPYAWSSCSHSGYIGPDYWSVRGFPSEGEPFYTDYYPPGQASTWLRLPNSGRSYSDRSGGPGPYLPLQGFDTADDAADYAHDHDPGAMVKMNFTAPPTQRVPMTGGGWNPNVWQLTGLADQQPFHIDPTTHKKVYDPPDPDLAKQVATTFDLMWNTTSNNYNGYEEGMDGSTGPETFINWRVPGVGPFSVPLNAEFPAPPVDWAWAVAIVDGYTDAPEVIGRWDVTNNNFDFAGGLPPAGWDLARAIVNGGDYGYRLWIFHPTTATPIKVTQLDPAIWDTSGDTPVRWIPKASV